jgi:hypothetical protein
MPAMMEGSILIMSKAGTGTAMFSMGEQFISSLLCNLFCLFYEYVRIAY